MLQATTITFDTTRWEIKILAWLRKLTAENYGFGHFGNGHMHQRVIHNDVAFAD